MRLNFGLIISRAMNEFMVGVLPEIRHLCDVDILLADSNEQAFVLYQAHWPRYDAVVFGGKIFQYYVSRQMPTMTKPCFAFDDVEMDIKKLLLRLVLEDRSFDFSRTFVDIAYEHNEFLGIKELLPPSQWPYFGEENMQLYGPLSVTGANSQMITQATLERHIQLHQQGKIDLSITRFGALVDVLEGMGYPCVYMLPSREHVISFFMQLIYSLDNTHSEKQGMGAVVLWFNRIKSQREETMGAVARSVIDYAGEMGLDINLQRDKVAIEILMPHQNLEQLTNAFTEIDFYRTLIPEGSEIAMGLGTGKSMYQARSNAKSALAIAPDHWEDVYFISADKKMIGPLEKNKQVLHREPTPRLQDLAQQFQIDHLNLQKVMACARMSNSNIVTAEGLANYMGVTQRTASRILGKILNNHGAECYSENISGRPGRPKKYYNLSFITPQLMNEELQIRTKL